MITPDNIEPIPFLILMALIVATWLIIGIRDRRRARRALTRWPLAFERQLAWASAGACAHIWDEDPPGIYYVCTRANEHTGPHLDATHQHLLRA